jgi:hypothetical protein
MASKKRRRITEAAAPGAPAPPPPAAEARPHQPTSDERLDELDRSIDEVRRLLEVMQYVAPLGP